MFALHPPEKGRRLFRNSGSGRGERAVFRAGATERRLLELGRSPILCHTLALGPRLKTHLHRWQDAARRWRPDAFTRY